MLAMAREPAGHHAAFCGLVHDAAAYLAPNVRHLQRLGRVATGYRIMLIENDSRDGTRSLLRALAAEDARLSYELLDLGMKTLSTGMCKPPIYNCPARFQLLARLRQRLLKVALEWRSCTIVVMVDLDFVWAPPEESFRRMLAAMRAQRSDAIFALGVNRACPRASVKDIGAIRVFGGAGASTWWPTALCADFQRGRVVRVSSGFGGFGVYDARAVRELNASYATDTNQIEHIDFNTYFQRLHVDARFRPIYNGTCFGWCELLSNTTPRAPPLMWQPPSEFPEAAPRASPRASTAANLANGVSFSKELGLHRRARPVVADVGETAHRRGGGATPGFRQRWGQLRDYLQTHWHAGGPTGTSCGRLERLGGSGDGGKAVCAVAGLMEPPCVVVSIGSNGDASFEREVLAKGPSCTVYTFDGTLTGQRAHLRHRLPLDDARFHFIAENMDSNHTSASLARRGITRISLLKVDCEGCEDTALLPLLRAVHVEQLLLEVHGCIWAERVGEAAALTKVDTLMNGLLREHRMRVFHAEPNILWSDGTCSEYSFMRSSADRPSSA